MKSASLLNSLWAGVFLGAVAFPALAQTGPAQVVDGDGVIVAGRELRLAGIDAPEWKQPCRRDGKDWYAGREATAALRSLIAGKVLACHDTGERSYRRPVVICYLNGAELNALIVEAGWAFDYAHFSGGRYAGQEALARAAGRGIWQGECQKPWDWRQDNR